MAEPAPSCRPVKILHTSNPNLFSPSVMMKSGCSRPSCRTHGLPRSLAACSTKKRSCCFCDGRVNALLPLDRPRRLAGHVVDHPVDALHLVDDARGGLAQKLHVELVEVGGHAVGGGDGAQAHDVVIRAAVSHYADGLHREQHGKSLPDLVVEAVLPDLV